MLTPFKKIAQATLSRALFVPSDCRVIFMCHDISTKDSPHHSPFYSLEPKTFQRKMLEVLRHFRFVPLDEIIVSKKKQRLASLTFDDGFLSVRSEAYLWLRSRGIPFTVFLNRDAIVDNRLNYGSEYPEINQARSQRVYLDQDDVRYLASQGVGIGNHSTSHASLSQCTHEQLVREISDNKVFLEGLTSSPVRHMAIPFGKSRHYSADALEVMRVCGHTAVFTTTSRYFRPAAAREELAIWPRIGLESRNIESILSQMNLQRFASRED